MQGELGILSRARAIVLCSLSLFKDKKEEVSALLLQGWKLPEGHGHCGDFPIWKQDGLWQKRECSQHLSERVYHLCL